MATGTGTKNNNFLESIFGYHKARANYLCNWSKRYKYIYVETPKVACTTIKRTLQLAEVCGDTKSTPKNVHDRAQSPIASPLSDIDGFKEVYESSDSLLFCFVRNPFTRALSCYLDKFVKNEWERQRLAPALGLDPDRQPSLIEFLTAVSRQNEHERDIHWSTQTFLLRPNRVRYSFIGRFENFAAQFSDLCSHLGMTSYAEHTGTNHATGADVQRFQFLGEQQIELIKDIYSADFQNFGYGWSVSVI